jgi:hypothetical protein
MKSGGCVRVRRFIHSFRARLTPTGTSAPRMSPASLLLYFAAQGTHRRERCEQQSLIGRKPAACPVQGVGCSPQRNKGGAKRGTFAEGSTRRPAPKNDPPRTSTLRTHASSKHNANRTDMTETEAREEICRTGRSLFERGYVHATAGQHQRAAGRRLPHHADRCMPRLSRPRAPCKARCARPADQRRPRQQDHRAAHPHLRRRAQVRREHGLRHPHAQHALRRAHAERRNRMPNCCPRSHRTSS